MKQERLIPHSSRSWAPLLAATVVIGLLTLGRVSGAAGPVLAVTNTNSSGPGSLAGAITQANLDRPGTTITFAIPKTDPGFDAAAGVWRIKVATALPPLMAERIVIDGESQTASVGDTNPLGPEIAIVGAGMTLDAGIAMVSAGGAVKGLAIGGFKHGVVLFGAKAIGNTVSGCAIGVGPDGRAAAPNGAGIIAVEGSRDNVIEDNLISGNALLGVYIAGRDTTGNTLRRNRIGTDALGQRRVPNGLGVMVSHSAGNAIGVAQGGNTISGNANVGILLVGKWTENNTIRGNRIGTNLDGSKLVHNNIGIVVKSLANRNQIGGAKPGEGNIISGNVEIGVYIESSDGNVLHGNLIGTDQTGTRTVEADGIVQGNGIEFDTVAKGNMLGGDGPGERNVISGHKVYGVVYYGHCERNSTIGNYIGTDITGTKSIPNATGICVDCASHHNTIARNVISGNMSYGLFFVTRGTEHNVLVGNKIGTNAAGDAALPNDIGMCVSTGACRNRIGGPNPEDANVFSGNTQTGLMITNQSTAENVVEGNLIGLDARGCRAIPNKHGLLFSTYPERNIVRRNTISGNSAVGVVLYEYSSGNEVTGNRIGTNVTGDGPVGNGVGVVIDHWCDSNRIGKPGEPNIVSHNLTGGILVGAAVGEGNQVSDNTVRDNAGVNTLVSPRETIRPVVEKSTTAKPATPAPVPSRMAAVGSARPAESPKPSRREFAVTTTRETGPGSFTAAINACNAAGGHADIRFDIPRTDAGFVPADGVWRIKLTDTPPELSVSDVRIDGWTQTHQHGDTNPKGPEVVLDGSNYTVEYAICLNNASGCEIRGLVIGGFIVGIQANGPGAHSNKITGNYLGVGADGVSLFGNFNGIELVSGARDNLVGGSEIHDCNLISGNEHVGIRISDANQNRVIGNLVGTDRTGMTAARNYDGICIEGTSSGNMIGGAQPGERNVFSGNVAYGVDLFGWGVTQNRVVGNFIGTDITGTRAVPNTYGVLFDDRSHHNLVGGTGPNEWNLISGNTAFGAYFYNNGTHSNSFQGNRIGTDVTGRYALPNETGVHIDGGTFDNTVDRNLISGNRVAGITLFSIKTDRNVITRNLIGTDIDGKLPLGNGADGIRIVFGSQNNTVGGSTPESNTIAYNGRAGIAIESPGSKRNRVWCNSIFGNAGLGIDIFPVGPNAAMRLSPADTPNAGMPAPRVQSVVAGKGSMTISGTVPGDRSAGTTVHVYAGDRGPGGDVQGRTFIGSVATRDNGTWSLTPAVAGPLGAVAATATDRDGNTSEFGGWLAPPPNPTPAAGKR